MQKYSNGLKRRERGTRVKKNRENLEQERERGRESERERDRQTDRQTDRQSKDYTGERYQRERS